MRYTLYIVALAAAILAHEARAQEVRGRVTDAEGRAVEPATVAVFRGDRQLAADVTDTAGRFRLAAPDGPYTLRVRHVARNAAVPVLTVAGMQFAELLSGAVVIENVFSLPGLGRLMAQSIANRDLLVVRNGVLLLVAMVVVINFIVDALAVLIDPRLKGR